MNEEETRKDLLKYYKMVKTCSNSECRRLFGVDGNTCGNKCPVCQAMMTYGQSRTERMEEFEKENPFEWPEDEESDNPNDDNY